MYGKQARNRSAQRQSARASDEDRTRPPMWVVRFRLGKDNKRRKIVYRHVTPFWSELAALASMTPGAESWCEVLVYADGRPERVYGDRCLVLRWCRQSKRKSLNHGRDPLTAGTYMERETASLMHREEQDAEEEFEG